MSQRFQPRLDDEIQGAAVMDFNTTRRQVHVDKSLPDEIIKVAAEQFLDRTGDEEVPLCGGGSITDFYITLFLATDNDNGVHKVSSLFDSMNPVTNLSNQGDKSHTFCRDGSAAAGCEPEKLLLFYDVF